MADNKKAFILYTDQKEIFEQLPLEKRGELISIIFSYVNDENPTVEDPILKMAFTLIKQVLKRDLIKWEERAGRSRNNGSKGGRPKNPTKPKKPNGLNDNPDEPKKPVIVNDIVNVNVTDIVIVKESVINSHSWIEQICMKKRLELNDVKQYLTLFLDDLELKADLDKPEKDIKAHFVNWLNIQIKNVKKNMPKTLEDKYAHLI